MKLARDKLLHIIAGAVISLAIGFAGVKLSPLPELLAIGLGVTAAVTVGWGKEYWFDAKRPDKHTVDKLDFYATALGGVLGGLVLLIADFFLRG